MRHRLEAALDSILYRSPAQPLFLRRSSRRLVVLAYHDVRDAECFERQVDYLTRALHPVSLDEVLEALQGGSQLPPGAVLVTFDDGDRTVYEKALPILSARGVPGVVFVIAGLLDTEQPVWWLEVEELTRQGATARMLSPLAPAARVGALKRMPDEQRLAVIEELRESVPGATIRAPQLRRSELRELESRGLRVGNHTLTHPCLDRCTPQQVNCELVRAHEILAEALDSPPRAFAYPNGNWDARAAATLASLGYDAAFLFDHRIGRFPPVDAFRISRVRVNSTTPLDRFRIIVSGLHPFLHHSLGRV